MVHIKSKISKKKALLAAMAVVLLALGSLFVLEKKQVTNFVGKDNVADTTDSNPKTTSTAPTAQEDFSDGNERQIVRNDRSEGMAQDTNGEISSIPPESQWSISQDKIISVYSPAQVALLESGGIVSGHTTYTQVNFRLIDDVSGVIAQGVLGVKNGKFSGSLSFSTTGTNGRLDIFNASADGVESSVVEIPVRFK